MGVGRPRECVQMGMSRGGWVPMRQTWDLGEVGTHPLDIPSSDMGPGIQRDTVGKRAVRISLECFLV